jgi:hypothetical protein
MMLRPTYIFRLKIQKQVISDDAEAFLKGLPLAEQEAKFECPLCKVDRKSIEPPTGQRIER